MTRTAVVRVIDTDPATEAVQADVLRGLGARPKTLPCKLFYDRLGSQLFEDICELDEYYLTRTELAILEANAADMAEMIGPECVVVELGSGASVKTGILLDALERPKAYVPVDISRSALVASAARIAAAYPGIELRPICADYTRAFDLWSPFGARGPREASGPRESRGAREARQASILAFYPGSTIGNFDRPDAVEFLARVRRLIGHGGKLLVGVDLKKDRATLEAAYNDRAGVTAEFNRNILRVLNRDHDAHFSLEAFAHRAVWNDRAGRIEMHLVSERRQNVTIGAASVHFDAGEHIVTEHSYKYDLDQFRALGRDGGFRVERVWTDADQRFSVQLLVAD